MEGNEFEIDQSIYHTVFIIQPFKPRHILTNMYDVLVHSDTEMLLSILFSKVGVLRVKEKFFESCMKE